MLPRVDPGSRKILIVEDDPNTLEVLTDGLAQEGYVIRAATSADEAFESLRSFKPDLILTDNDMPGFSGHEMLKELRKLKNWVTVIFVSGRTDPGHVANVIRDGADDYIRKPFRFEELVARIESSLRTHDLHGELMKANEKLQEKVDRDYLTGLFNMRSMYQKIDFELKRAKRFKRNVSVVMLDMDYFKTVNDQNDHLFGSFVLKDVGNILQQTMREIDFAARYGGDEFLAVLTETDAPGTKIFCERLRSNIEKNIFENDSSSIQLTASIGFAVARGEEDYSAREIVKCADRNLYKAKEAGRNQCNGGWAADQ